MSRRLVIAIDCDDVLINATEYLVDTYNSRYGTSVRLLHAHQSRNVEWEANRVEVFRRIVDIQQSEEYAAIAPHESTVEVIHRIARDHELHLVTARLNEVMPVTVKMINTYFEGCFTSIEHVGPDRPKGEICKSIGANVMIDDNLHHLESADAHGVEYVIWFGDYPWQLEIDHRDLNVARCGDWKQVEEELDSYAKQ